MQYRFLDEGWKLYECPTTEVIYVQTKILRVHVAIITGELGGLWSYSDRDIYYDIEHAPNWYRMEELQEYLSLDRELKPLPAPLIVTYENGKA